MRLSYSSETPRHINPPTIPPATPPIALLERPDLGEDDDVVVNDGVVMLKMGPLPIVEIEL